VTAGRPVIIGSGVNGLVCAYYLAKAGLQPIVLEARDEVGGAVLTNELLPGFRCPTLAHVAGPLRADIAADLALEKEGVGFLRPDPRLFVPAPDGGAIVLYDDPRRSADQIVRVSKVDAGHYVEFQQTLAAVGQVIAGALEMVPPDIDEPATGDLWELAKIGRRFRALGRRDSFRLLRWMPMAVADLVAEHFESDLLRAAVAARGVFGTFMGPWSAGSGAVLLLRAAADPHPAGSTVFVSGGPGALARAMATVAERAGATIRTGSPVDHINVTNGTANGVTLGTGEEIPATAVISGADPKRTYLQLLDPVHLDPDFLTRVRNYRCEGTVAKVNLALSELPRFTAAAGAGNGPAVLSGRIQISPGIDYLERAFDAAKYGTFSDAPYLEAVIPSLADPSLAPAGAHVMSIYVQFAPRTLRDGSWTDRRDELGKVVTKTLAEYAPNLPAAVISREVITPEDLETRHGLSGGHIFHGELAIDQLFTMRPLLGWARYRTPVRKLYLCGSGTHPGLGLTGASGALAAREILKDLRRAR
jgi:phytoene dehydrogenase-like protein